MDYSRLISLVQIENVRIIDASIRTKISLPDEGMAAHLAQSIKLSEPVTTGKLAYRAAFRFAVKPTAQVAPSATPVEELVSIRAAFEATYRLPDGEVPDQQLLDQFGSVNVLFNVWPYWREFLQSSLLRMSLPPFTAPVLRPPQPPPEAGKTLFTSTEQSPPSEQ